MSDLAQQEGGRQDPAGQNLQPVGRARDDPYPVAAQARERQESHPLRAGRILPIAALAGRSGFADCLPLKTRRPLLASARDEESSQ